jgi:uncharacterized membrane protein YfcA
MIDYIQNLNISPLNWSLVFLSAFLIGAAKTGLSGVSMVSIPLMAMIFGGKQSVGLILPMLIVADIFAVSYYNKHANWLHLIKLIPWAAAGILLATLLGNYINDAQFKTLIAIIILLGIAIMLLQDFTKLNKQIPNKYWFAALLGLAGGFASMVGNAAGPIMALYLLSMRFTKNTYIGTGAWFFFVLNVIKIPFHTFVWKTIHIDSLLIGSISIPFIIAGSFTGLFLVKYIPEKAFRYFVIGTTLISAIFLF